MKNIGIIGCGYWGAKHARVLSELSEATLYGVADLDASKLQAIAEKYPWAKSWNNLTALLDDPAVDGVIIATPASTHYQLALQALQANKHVLVEKPLSVFPEQAQHLIDLAHHKGLTLMVGHTFEYHPAVKKLREVVESGELGDLYYMEAARLNLGLYQRDVNVIHDLSPHDISVMIHVLGQRPVEVTARGYSMVHGGVVDVAYLEYRFASGFVANSRVSWLAPRKVREMVIVGSKKMAVYDDTAEKDPIGIYDRGITPPQETEQFSQWKFAYQYGDVTSLATPGGEPLKQEVTHFLDCIETGQPPLTDGVNGRTVVSVLHAAQLSLQKGGRPQTINYYDTLLSLETPRRWAVGAIGRQAAASTAV